MNATFRALLAGIMDYAGIFPPAQLDLDTAVRNYARYRGEPDAWMLGRFIIPAPRLSQLSGYCNELFASGEPMRLSALGRGGASTAEFLEHLTEDLHAISVFSDAQKARARVEALETRAPEALVNGEIGPIREFLHEAGERVVGLQLAPLTVSLELSLEGDWQRAHRTWAAALDAHNQDHAAAVGRWGLKLRCGGVTANAFPSVELVARVIESCRDPLVPLKFTAGLHHPTRRFDAGVRTDMHGFVNVFGAAVLGYTLRLDHADMRAIIDERDPRHFHFSDEFFGWDQAEATAAEIRYAREHVALSFGTCSFDEPRDDLRALGWLT